MADSFGGGLAEGLNGLLGSLRNDRERKAQEQFKQKLISQDNATNREIADRSRKQQALQLFGQGLSKIQENNVNSALTQLQGNATKHARSVIRPLDEYQKQFAKINDEISTIETRLSFGEAKANAKAGDSLGGLLADNPADKNKPKEDPNTPVLQLLKAKVAERDQLKSIINGGMAEQQALQSDVESRAQQLKNYTVDDALNTREAKVLQLSLGLTDDDVAQFRDGSKPSGTDFNAILGKPFSSTLGVPNDHNPKLDSLLTPEPSSNVSDIADVKAKLQALAANNDVSAWKDLTEQDITTAQSVPELNSLLTQAQAKTKDYANQFLNKLNAPDANPTPEDYFQLNNLSKLGSYLSKEDQAALSQGKFKSGASMGIGLLSDLLTKDAVSKLSGLNQKAQVSLEQQKTPLEQYNNGGDPTNSWITNTAQYVGSVLGNQSTDPNYRKTQQAKNRDSLDSLGGQQQNIGTATQNINNLSSYLRDPNKQYQYKPVDFGATK